MTKFTSTRFTTSRFTTDRFSVVGDVVSVSINGLTGGVAVIGSHASITMSVNEGTITARKWGSTNGGSEYGTGTSPTDFEAGDEGILYATATVDGSDFTSSTLIQYAVAVNTVAPAVTGDTGYSDVLSTSNGTWTGATGGSYSYQWQSNGTDISGATSSSYMLTENESGASITAIVTYTNSGGAESATSNSVTADTLTSPAVAETLAITGTETVGETLSLTGGAVTGTPTPTVAYQWRRGGVNIGGATSSTYTLAGADEGENISCTKTATNVVGSDSDTSDEVGPIAAAASEVTATQGNVTFTIDGSYTTGNYADGPAYVVIPNGSTDINSISPAETTLGGRVINGAMKNPALTSSSGEDQGFDARVTTGLGGNYNASDKWTPGSVTAGDVIIKSISSQDSNIVADDRATQRRGVIEEYGTLFVVASAPSAGSFSPAAVGWTGRSTPTAYTPDVSTFVSGLPSYSNTGQDALTYAEVIDKLKYSPTTAMWGENPYAHQYHDPAGSGNLGSSVNGNYGQFIGGNIQAAMLALISSGFTTSQKEEIATRLISKGIQWFDTYDGAGVQVMPNGGLYQFFFGPMAMALETTGRTAKFQELWEDQSGNQRQAFKVTSTQAGQFVPHDSVTQPSPYRRRNLDAISSNTLTIETYRVGNDGDNGKFDFVGFTVTNGTAEAIVTGPTGSVNVPSGSSGSLDITVDDATGFSANDTLTFYPPVQAIEGDYQWTIEGLAAFNQYAGEKGDGGSYRALNNWSGLVLGLRGMGIWDSAWDPMQGYVMSANRADWYTSTWNFSDHHATSYGASDLAHSWEADFWDDHAATILDLAAPTISGVSVATDETELTVSYSTNSTGRVRVLAFPSGATATNPALLLRGLDNSGTAAVASSSVINVTSTGAQTDVVLTGLTAGTEYEIRIISDDVWTNPAVDSSTATTDAAASGFAVDEGSSTATFTTSGGFRIATLGDGDTLVVTTGDDVNAILVGGGGGGGGRRGGGGGAGEYVARSTAGTALTLTAQTYTATVGSGGAGGSSANGTQGSNTTFAGLTALGGGYGGTIFNAGADGGSGGGAGSGSNNVGTSTASDGVGNSGGADNVNTTGGGGGGGAGGAGTSGATNTGGSGGTGIASPVPGESGFYAGGGGGGNANPGTFGPGGSTVGGNGGDLDTDTAATVGAAGTGSGGGGGYDKSGAPGHRVGAAGGSGTVKVWWPV